MSMMDYKDKLDAERALRLAKSHGEGDDSILAFRDRLDARRAVKDYNNTQESLRRYHERMGEESVDEAILVAL